MSGTGSPSPPTGTTPPVAFEEFKLYFESAERVTDRRLELTRANSSLATLVIAGLGITAGWAYDKPDVETVALAGVALVSFLSVLFCMWWRKQIESYKDLNSAKFDVLNDMATHLQFERTSGTPLPSAQPFVREWKYLEAKALLQRYKSGFALRATRSELVVPNSFLALFAIACACSTGYCAALLAGCL